MNVPAAQSISLWPLVVYFAAVVATVIAMLALSYVLGQRRREKATVEPFESGIVPVGYARFRLSAKFYLIALLFVIFDLEAIFIFAWAVAYREAGWMGYAGILVFIVILIVALIYEWRLGALDWGAKGRNLSTRTRS